MRPVSRMHLAFRSLMQTLVALSLALGTAASAASDCPTYELTVRNENSGQNFSPSVIVIHDAAFSLFEPGAPASEPLWRLAEDGDPGGFQALAGVNSDVVRVVVAPRAHRKKSPVVNATLTACAGQRVSVAAMLAATNDGFVAARGLRLPEPGESVEAELRAFDAGSEANTESCAHVPCEVHGRRMIEGAEGIVQPHAGIRGDADIPRERGWSGEVLGRVTVRRAS